MSKVFSDFRDNIFVNSRVVILVLVGIAIAASVAIAATTSTTTKEPPAENPDDKSVPEQPVPPEIQKKLDDVTKTKLENKYSPKPRDWPTSGPFQIDRSEYILGEKIFLIIGQLDPNEKGEVVFLRPSNSTHYAVYWKIPFDGADNAVFNNYLQPQLSKSQGYCTADAFIGDWRVVFSQTNYANLEFKITGDILPGDEENYEPVC